MIIIPHNKKKVNNDTRFSCFVFPAKNTKQKRFFSLCYNLFISQCKKNKKKKKKGKKINGQSGIADEDEKIIFIQKYLFLPVMPKGGIKNESKKLI